MYPSSNYSPISSLFHIPSSPSLQYEHELFEYFHDPFLLQQPQQQQQQLLKEPDQTSNKMEEGEGGEGEILQGCNEKKKHRDTSSTNRGGSKKDRHSKINTAHGPRDRRMRLSLEVARKFFNLQDLLGFDKASKTVDWLLNKSKSAVNELVQGLNNKDMNCSATSQAVGAISPYSSTTSECEVISGIEESTTANVINRKQLLKGEKKKAKMARRGALHTVAKENRKQARARARERTKIKKSFDNSNNNMVMGGADAYLKRLGTWCPFENAEESSIHQEHDKQTLGTKENNVILDDTNLVVPGSWPSPYATIFNFHHINEISNENQFTNFQFSGKLWEG